MRSARFMTVVAMGIVAAVAFTGCSKFRGKKALGEGDSNVISVPGNGLDGVDTGSVMGGDRLAGTETKGQFPTVLFAYDSSQVEGAERTKIEEVASFLKNSAAASLVVEGHCDERGSNEYNLALGERRALAIRAYLIGLGVGGERIQTKSMGEESPTAMGHDEESWRLNRRGEFVLIQ